METPNTASLTDQFRILGQTDDADLASFPRIQRVGMAVSQGQRGVRAKMTGRASRTIRVETLARVEGEGSLYIKLMGDRVADVKLKIYEPPRFFEALLRGRHFSEAPDITARICGICPIAYQMSAIHAIERALGIRVDPGVRLLRRLFYCGEWIESHALHVYMLHAPDFLGCPGCHRHGQRPSDRGGAGPAAEEDRQPDRHRCWADARFIPFPRPWAVSIKYPTKQQLRELVEDLEWALEASLETVRWTGTLEFPDFEQDYEFVALRHPDEYPFNEGRLVSNRGLNIDAAEYEDHFVEQHVKHSNALHSVVRGRGSYLVGPLARFNLNFDQLPDVAQKAASEAELRPPVKNPFRSIIGARGRNGVCLRRGAAHYSASMSHRPIAAGRGGKSRWRGPGHHRGATRHPLSPLCYR